MSDHDGKSVAERMMTPEDFADSQAFMEELARSVAAGHLSADEALELAQMRARADVQAIMGRFFGGRW